MPQPSTGALAAFLSQPDAVLPAAGPPLPRAVAVRTAAGLAGAALFVATFAIGIATAAHGPDADELARLLRLAAVPPVAAALAFPPLVLVTALRGREVGLLRLAGVAAGGPTIAGLWAGAASPVLLLYALTGEIGTAFALLTAGIGFVAAIAGAIGAVRNARRAGDANPGPAVVLAHYALFGWTALILVAHLL